MCIWGHLWQIRRCKRQEVGVWRCWRQTVHMELHEEDLVANRLYLELQEASSAYLEVHEEDLEANSGYLEVRAVGIWRYWRQALGTWRCRK